MTITDISGYKSETPTNPDASVGFKGQIILTGEIYHTSPSSELGEQICMDNLDNNSLATIPEIAGSNFGTGFCFSNLEKAKQIFQNGQESKL